MTAYRMAMLIPYPSIAVAHMIEEIPNASVEGPKIMIACVGIGVTTGFIFLTVLLFVAGNPEDIIESAAGPLLQIFLDATGSHAGSVCLLMCAPSFPLPSREKEDTDLGG